MPQEPLTHLSMTLPDEAVMRGMSAIDLISLRVRIRLMLRVSWLQNIWGASQRPENWNWVAFGQDFPEVESEWIKTHETAKSLTNVLVECEDVLSAKIGQYRTALTEGLKLNSEELDFLDFCVAIYREPALMSLVASCFELPTTLLSTETFVRHIFGYRDLAYDIYQPNSPLAIWGLIAPKNSGKERRTLEVDPSIVAYINGSIILDDNLSQYAQIFTPKQEIISTQAVSVGERLKPLLESNQKVWCNIDCRPNDMATEFAADISRSAGVKMLSVRLPENIDRDLRIQIAMRAERLSLLAGLSIMWSGMVWHDYPYARSICPLVITLLQEGQATRPSPVSTTVQWNITISPPTVEEKRVFGERLLDRLNLDFPEAQELLRVISADYGASYTDITQVLRRRPQSLDEARRYLERRISGRKTNLGYILAPRQGWEDIILPDALQRALRRIVYEAQFRLSALEQPTPTPSYLKTGMPVMLHGPSGTGKTLACEVIAKAIGRNLFVVDGSSVISKYVGETSVNLKRVFHEAKLSGDIVFIDEADTFFAKRTAIKDANDVHNTGTTNNLLQMIERHPGITLLATNRYEQTDEAFKRRTRKVIEFFRPEFQDRLTMWRKMLCELIGADAARLDPLMTELSRNMDVTLAQIKNAAITAYFLAEKDQVDLVDSHIFEGLSQELSKDSRTVSSADMARIRRKVSLHMAQEERAA